MELHRDIPLEISSVCFSDFNQGKEVTHLLPAEKNLQPREWFWWQHNKITGTAEVISISGTGATLVAVIKKIY